MTYAVVTVWGFIDGNSVLWIMPVDAADNWLHVALTAASLLIGFTAGGLGLAGRRRGGE